MCCREREYLCRCGVLRTAAVAGNRLIRAEEFLIIAARYLLSRREESRAEQSRAEMKVSGQEIRAPAGRAGQGWDGVGSSAL